MTLVIIIALLIALFVMRRRKVQAESLGKDLEQKLQRSMQEARSALEQQQTLRTQYAAELEAQRVRLERQARRVAEQAQALYETKARELEAYGDQLRNHYEDEATRLIEQERSALQDRLAELEPLQVYAGLRASEVDVQRILADAMADANALRREAEQLVERERAIGLEERQSAQQRAKDVRAQIEARLLQATRDAARIVSEAEQRAETTGGEAFLALREKQEIERALQAIRNVVEGYGDRYVVPTHSLLDDLAEELGHTGAGEELRASREQSRRLVEAGEAADCDYVEPERRTTAIRFLVDAFNGRVDASLSTVKATNFGTL
jgi:hypothetical protein